MPQATLPEFDTLHDILRGLGHKTDVNGQKRLMVTAITEDKTSVMRALTIASSTGGADLTAALDCAGFHRVSVAVRGEAALGDTLTYNLQWSMDGINWFDDYIAQAGAATPTTLPLTVLIPTIAVAFTAAALEVINNAGYMADIKAKWVRVKATTAGIGAVLSFDCQLF